MYEVNTWLIILPSLDITFWRWVYNKLLYLYSYSGIEIPWLHFTWAWWYCLYADIHFVCKHICICIYTWAHCVSVHLVAYICTRNVSDSLWVFICYALKLWSYTQSFRGSHSSVVIFFFLSKLLLPIGMLQGKKRVCFQCQFVCNKTTFTASPEK